MALFHALHFGNDRNKERSKILIPASKKDKDRVIILMYYFGGYPGSWLPTTTELSLVIEKFIDPDLVFLRYAKVPDQYLPWLGDQFLYLGIIGQGSNRILWCYKSGDAYDK